jgi:hypothetical protein
LEALEIRGLQDWRLSRPEDLKIGGLRRILETSRGLKNLRPL